MSRSAMLHIGYLEPHPDNIREDTGDISETAASIMVHGIIQPLTAVPRPDKPGYFWVIAGSRRLAAAKRARVEQIPVTIRRDNLTPEQVTEIMLIENCHRAGLNPMEKAEAMGRLRKRGKTSQEIARSIGMSDATVCQYLALLELSAATQEKVRRGELSAATGYRAVKQTRKATRKRQGRPQAGAVWEPDYLTATHPLARKAQAMCDAREHTARRRIGKTACGACWESVIRADERVVAATLHGVSLESGAVGFIAPEGAPA
jgi:ParB family transcriptional regulator, chromosome partitioning protein